MAELPAADYGHVDPAALEALQLEPPACEGWLEKASGGHKAGLQADHEKERRSRSSSSERLSGLLGNLRTGWDKRYVILRGRTIKYYKYEEDAAKGAEKGAFDCRDATFCLYPATHTHMAHYMVLSNDERELTLRVSTSKSKGKETELVYERARWAAALEAACETNVTARLSVKADVPLM